jgi:hypothetical protein
MADGGRPYCSQSVPAPSDAMTSAGPGTRAVARPRRWALQALAEAGDGGRRGAAVCAARGRERRAGRRGRGRGHWPPFSLSWSKKRRSV